MHFLRIRTIIVDSICRDSLAEVCLEAVNAHIQQDFQLILEPLVCGRIGKIYDSHTGLPHIPLPYFSVRTLDEVAFLHTFLEQNGFLANVGIDPHTDI